MSGSHSHPLHYHGHGHLHRMAPHLKLIGLVVFVIAVVSTPRQQVWAFSVYALLVMVIAVLSDVPGRFLLSRMMVVAPFILASLLLPVLGGPPRLAVGPLSLSIDGLWGAWNVVAKASIGVAASVVFASTTEPVRAIAALDRLRLPAPLTSIAGFMLRYLDLTVADVSRSITAMRARGLEPRWWPQGRLLASLAGTMFVRAYERGERIHGAMIARGYQGHMPRAPGAKPTWSGWLGALLPGATAVVVATWALVAR